MTLEILTPFFSMLSFGSFHRFLQLVEFVVCELPIGGFGGKPEFSACSWIVVIYSPRPGASFFAVASSACTRLSDF